MPIMDSYVLDRGWCASVEKTNGFRNGQKQVSEFRTKLIDEDGNTIHTQVGHLSEADCNAFIMGWYVGFDDGFRNGQKVNAASTASILKRLIEPDLD